LAQISRAYSPIHPEHIIPISYLRTEADLGLTVPATVNHSSFSGADTFAEVTCDLD